MKYSQSIYHFQSGLNMDYFRNPRAASPLITGERLFAKLKF
jgi:hypothetical protein